MPITRPNWANADDRDTAYFDICTGSTQDKPVAYDRDLEGCGQKDYTFFRISEAGNNIIDCVKTPVYGLSISGFVRKDENSRATITAVINALQTLVEGRITDNT